MSTESIVTAKDLHQMTQTTKSRSASELAAKVEAAVGNLFIDNIHPAAAQGLFSVVVHLRGSSPEARVFETAVSLRLIDLGFTTRQLNGEGTPDPEGEHTEISWLHPKPAKVSSPKAAKTPRKKKGASVETGEA